MRIIPLPKRIRDSTKRLRPKFPMRSALGWGVLSAALLAVYLFLPFAYHDPGISSFTSALSMRFVRGWGVITHLAVRDGATPPTVTSSGSNVRPTTTPPIVVEPPKPMRPPVHIPCGTRLAADTMLEADMQCSGTALIIAAGITLDCDSYKIRGVGNAEAGIVMNNVTGAVVRNCVVENFLEGMIVRGGADITISDTRLEKNGDPSTRAGQGMRVEGGSERLTIIGNTFEANYGDGIQVSDAPKGLFRGNEFIKNGSENILVLGGREQTWEENTSSESGENALYIRNVHQSRFAGNLYDARVTIGSNSSENIFSSESIDGSRLIINDSINNTFANIAISGAGGNTCLQFKNSSGNIIKDGMLSECTPDSVVADGVSLTGGTTNMLIRTELPKGGRIVERNSAHLAVE